VAGFLFGVAALVRPNVVTMFPGIAVGAWFLLRRERRPWLVPAMIASLGLVLAVSPWVIRNHRVHDRWFFVSTGGGRQFWFGNNEQTTGTTRVHPDPDPAMWAELMRLPDEFAQEAYFYRQGVEFMREHPGRAAWLYLVKMGNLLAIFPDTKTQTYMSPLSQGAQGLASLVVYAGALLALRRWRREPLLWVMSGGVLSYCVVSAFYFSCMRYRMAVEPCLLLMAGLGFADLWARRSARPGLAAAPSDGGPAAA
jgi:4-amino-4-deoxy-L-arabinose transferase-like glycosyltransferase